MQCTFFASVQCLMLQMCGKLQINEDEHIQPNYSLQRPASSHLQVRERRRFSVLTEVNPQ